MEEGALMILPKDKFHSIPLGEQRGNGADGVLVREGRLK